MVKIDSPRKTKSSCQFLGLFGSHNLRANIGWVGNNKVKTFRPARCKQRRCAGNRALFKDVLKEVFAFKVKMHVRERRRNSPLCFAQRPLVRIKTKDVNRRFGLRKQFLQEAQEQLTVPDGRVEYPDGICSFQMGATDRSIRNNRRGEVAYMSHLQLFPRLRADTAW